MILLSLRKVLDLLEMKYIFWSWYSQDIEVE